MDSLPLLRVHVCDVVQVEKSNTATIAELVLTCEQIINEEHTAWVSTGHNKNAGKEQGEGAASANEGGEGGFGARVLPNSQNTSAAAKRTA